MMKTNIRLKTLASFFPQVVFYSFEGSRSSFVLIYLVGLEKGISLHVGRGSRVCSVSLHAQIQVVMTC